MSDYALFLRAKQRTYTGGGVTVDELPTQLYDWQAAIVRWALKKGRAAIFADCGLGKTFMQVAWANALDVPVLMLAPLCVAEQTVNEAAKLGIDVHYATDQDHANGHRLVITNYERLDKFDVTQFQGVVLDESSILKAFNGKTRTRLIEAFQHAPFRLCCTATPSPNDISELANHAEFLGLMTRPEFLATWFINIQSSAAGKTKGWRMKRHAVEPFYRWMSSWAVAVRSPSDLGYSDDGFILPRLTIHDVTLTIDGPMGDSLFPEMGGKGLSGRLAARRTSMVDRVEAVSRLIANGDGGQWLLWCGLNEEADALTKAIPGAVNVSGSDSYDEKVGAVQAFIRGEIQHLVSKVRILGFGMNFQHCHNMAFVGMSDSYEAYYQAIRRCWRYGQSQPVSAHVVVSEAERAVVENVRRKEQKAAGLSANLLRHMRDFERVEIT
tara:strand:+ start:6144 stop:7460 length:1317 start_codon:yes stop_codon:yes gene_type:complete